MANILRVVLTGRQLNRIMWNFLVRQLTQQMIDAVQASAFFGMQVRLDKQQRLLDTA